MNVAPLALFDVVPVEVAAPGASPTPETFAALLLTAAPAPAQNAAESSVLAPIPTILEAALPEPVSTDLAAPIVSAPFAHPPRQVLQVPPVDDESTLHRDASPPADQDEAPTDFEDAPRPLDPAAPIAVAAIVAPAPASGRIMLPDTAAVARVAPAVEVASQGDADAPHRQDRPLQQKDGSRTRAVEVATALPVIQPLFPNPSPVLKSDAQHNASVEAEPDRLPTLEQLAPAVPARVAVPARAVVPARAAVLAPATTPTPVVAAAFPIDAFAVETPPAEDFAPVSLELEPRPRPTAASSMLAVRSLPTLSPVPVASAVAVTATRTTTVISMPLASTPVAVDQTAAPTTTPRVGASSASRRPAPNAAAQGIEAAIVPAPAQQSTAEPAASAATVRSNSPTPAPEPTQVETEALGTVAIALDRRDAALHVHFTVDRTSTAHALLDAARLLDGALQSGGTRLDQLSVDVRGGDGRNGAAAGSDTRNPAPQSDGSGQRAPARDPRTPDAQRTFLPPAAPRHPRGTAQDRFA